MTFDTALEAFKGNRALMQEMCGVSQSCISGWKAQGTVPHYVQTIVKALYTVDRLQEELAAAQTTIRQLAAMLNK